MVGGMEKEVEKKSSNNLNTLREHKETVSKANNIIF